MIAHVGWFDTQMHLCRYITGTNGVDAIMIVLRF
jgi:hypothetical protein